MIRIGLMSDTHSHLDEKVFKYFENCDEIWHAGDVGDFSLIETLEDFKPLRAVYGNIDNDKVRRALPLNLHFEVEGLRVFMTHIANYPGRYNKRARGLIEEHKPQLVICGHSHILKIIRDKTYGHLHMNPGACGIVGIHQVKTLVRFSIEKGKIKDVEVIEIGGRGYIASDEES